MATTSTISSSKRERSLSSTEETIVPVNISQSSVSDDDQILNEEIIQKLFRNFRGLDSVINGLNSRRTPALMESVFEAVSNMIGENFCEKDLLMIISICSEAYQLKVTSNKLLTISINKLWPQRDFTLNASHVPVESRLHEFRKLLTSATYGHLNRVKSLQAIVDNFHTVDDCSATMSPQKKRRGKGQSHSMREVLDLVLLEQEQSKAASIPATHASVDSLRDEVIRRGDLRSSQLLSEKNHQQQIDRLSVLAFLSTAADLIRLFCRLQHKSIFPLLEVTKYLTTTLHLHGNLNKSSFSSSFPDLKVPTAMESEYVVLLMLSEVAPEYLTILPADEANGVGYVTVRVNLHAPMKEVREKLAELSENAINEKKKLLGECEQSNSGSGSCSGCSSSQKK